MGLFVGDVIVWVTNRNYWELGAFFTSRVDFLQGRTVPGDSRSIRGSINHFENSADAHPFPSVPGINKSY